LPTDSLLNVIRREAPQFWDMAEVVGKWIWIQFEQKQPRQITTALSQLAELTAEDADWSDRTISYRQNKTDAPVVISFGAEVALLLQTISKAGPLFPRIGRIKENHRAKMFIKRLRTVGITGNSMHSYRYAWAERAKTAGMPKRFAQQALRHSSKAFARAYSRKAKVIVPPLKVYESKIVQLPPVVNQ
jgi:integrase